MATVMTERRRRSPWVPFHVLFALFPAACFIGALFTDITYAQTANIQWANFSAWLLAIGLAIAVIDAVIGLIDAFRRRRRRAKALWGHVAVSGLLLILVLFNNIVHARDGWTSVVPAGLILSGITVGILCVMAVVGYFHAPRYVGSVS